MTSYVSFLYIILIWFISIGWKTSIQTFNYVTNRTQLIIDFSHGY